MLLCTDASDLPAMQRYLHTCALAHPAFRAKIDAAALKVLEVKQGGT